MEDDKNVKRFNDAKDFDERVAALADFKKDNDKRSVQFFKFLVKLDADVNGDKKKQTKYDNA
jgi:hypothetical protein